MEGVFAIVVLIASLALGVYFFKTLFGGVGKESLLPYKAKHYFFTRSEQEFLRIFSGVIDHRKYLIFSKVRLADFIEVTARGKEYRGWWNKIKSKHVDFLLWDLERNKIALVVELDGKSHRKEKTRERDAFVNKLYEQIHIRLERIKVGSDFKAEAERIAKSLNV